MLIQAGAKLWARNVYGIEALFTAAQCNAADVLNYLICKGKNLYYFFGYKTDNKVLITQFYSSSFNLVIYSLGGDVNTQANDDATALFEASKNGHAEAVEILLSKRADVNKANKTGLLPIHVAAKNGHDRLGLLQFISYLSLLYGSLEYLIMAFGGQKCLTYKPWTKAYSYKVNHNITNFYLKQICIKKELRHKSASLS